MLLSARRKDRIARQEGNLGMPVDGWEEIAGVVVDERELLSV
jgi:hypothetical protein